MRSTEIHLAKEIETPRLDWPQRTLNFMSNDIYAAGNLEIIVVGFVICWFTWKQNWLARVLSFCEYRATKVLGCDFGPTEKTQTYISITHRVRICIYCGSSAISVWQVELNLFNTKKIIIRPLEQNRDFNCFQLNVNDRFRPLILTWNQSCMHQFSRYEGCLLFVFVIYYYSNTRVQLQSRIDRQETFTHLL